MFLDSTVLNNDTCNMRAQTKKKHKKMGLSYSCSRHLWINSTKTLSIILDMFFISRTVLFKPHSKSKTKSYLLVELYSIKRSWGAVRIGNLLLVKIASKIYIFFWIFFYLANPYGIYILKLERKQETTILPVIFFYCRHKDLFLFPWYTLTVKQCIILFFDKPHLTPAIRNPPPPPNRESFIVEKKL